MIFMDKITKSQAKAQGLRRYYTGGICAHGHQSERFVSNKRCVSCSMEAARLWKVANRHKGRERQAAERARDPEKVNARKRAHYASSAAARAAQKIRARRWYVANKEKSFEAHRQWAERNPHTTNAAAARRRASVLQRRVAWADHAKIKSIYRDAQLLTEMTGVEHHVDHEIPLQGDLVSGLHVESNLKILPGFLNQSKGARFDASALWSN